MRLQPSTPTGLHLFRPPYHTCDPIETGCQPSPLDPGGAAVWFLKPVASVWDELAWVTDRPQSLPLIVVLPEPEEIVPLAPILRAVPGLRPKGVLPTAPTGTMSALRTLLAAPPPSLPASVADYLQDLRVIQDEETRQRIMLIFASAPHIRSIQTLARKLAHSRRSLGRFFSDRHLPVPSHWLQFARLLHVAIQLQNTRASVNRVSSRFGYTDGFTLSNSMKRLTGYRPSFVREHLGWEWIVAAWLEQERRGEGE